ncbi:hypothetical protein P152DRAFT_431604 [Eremomyces bilateralis CBS 781.70]|uniref:F-box domain-containing protein n=1 Tax=Eremomyces bilateralis CBS 781.70 TaxID=1392243 RepID=A0A6G1GBA0_9PEZI|nr:uncharacterized protein P152DRAFT_431604 [Eremomyces bilateralis CBS 781.70]KAF1815216.1 hypothetical protein P152DRAFT_431604 [Eremomyces bilateralis CBS 781.70]
MSDSPFLRLPAELRELIYNHVLVFTISHKLRRLFSRGHLSTYLLDASPYSFPVSLLQTCRLIHSEATPILYTRNTFTAHPELLTSLPCLLAPERPIRSPRVTRLIQRWYIGVRLDIDPPYSRDAVSRAFTGVKSLVIEPYQPMFDPVEPRGALRLFEGVRGVRRAKVLMTFGGDGWGKYAEWLEDAIRADVDAEVEEYPEGSDVEED